MIPSSYFCVLLILYFGAMVQSQWDEMDDILAVSNTMIGKDGEIIRIPSINSKRNPPTLPDDEETEQDQILTASNTIIDANGKVVMVPTPSQKKKTSPECLLNAPVCGETAKRLDKAGKRIRKTFANQCRLDQNNETYGSGFSKINDGQCECYPCARSKKPVCYSSGDDYNDNKGFLNECFYERYLCLHGDTSLSFKMYDGPCQICKKNFGSFNDGIYFNNMEKQKMKDYMQTNVSWQNKVKCEVDTRTPLIAE